MATVTVRIPTPLRSYTGGADQVRVEGGTIDEVLQALTAAHDGIGARILDSEGRPRNFVNLFLGGRNVRTLEGLSTRVADGDVLSIVPAVAGGLFL